jgi:uncharacterized membrane protein
MNLAAPERIGSVIGGGALVAYGLSQRSLGGFLLALVGGAFLRRGVTGHCDVYGKLGTNSRDGASEAGVRGNKGINMERTITVARPRQEVYRVWRKLENLARFMDHVKEVRTIDGRRSHWVVKAPAGMTVEWDAEIISEHDGSMISWQSLPGAQVQNAGSVWFEEDGNAGSTRVKVALQYQPPAGPFGAAVAKLFGEAPDQQLDEDLARFKQLMESGGLAGAA